MATSSSNLVDNLTEGIHKIKGEDCDCFLEDESVKDNLIKYKCLSCNKDYSNKLDEKLKKRSKNIFKFSDNDVNKFISLLRKDIYPHECMDDWKNFNETILPEKEEFYSNLNMEDITDADYLHVKRVCGTLLLADVFENVRKMCLKIYHSDPVKFLSASALARKAALKKTEVKLELLTDIDMLLMVEKGIRGDIYVMQFINMQKLI